MSSTNQVANTSTTNIVPVQALFDNNGNCLGLVGPGGQFFSPPLTSDVIVNATIDNSVIGGTTPASGTFTNLQFNNILGVNGNLLYSTTLPTIKSGFGTGATITASSTAAFSVVVGTGGAGTGVIQLPAAAHGWVLQGWDITQGTALFLQQTAYTTTSATIESFGITTGSPSNMSAGDVLVFTATAF
jgi:hypothetical protein